MVQNALGERASVCSLAMLAALAIGSATIAVAQPTTDQSAAEHAAQAHGHPIVDGHPVQPTPAVVEERQRHHQQMLEAERRGSVRPLAAQPPPAAAENMAGSGARR